MINLESLLKYFEESEQIFEFGGASIGIVDPQANRVIGNHYSMSHYWAGLLLFAKTKDDAFLQSKADKIFNYIVNTMGTFVKESDYHNDFNNFIWALMLELNSKKFNSELLNSKTKKQLKQWILEVDDSKHFTINWLPMRILVNEMRNELKPQKKNIKVINKCLNYLKKAQNDDGFFEDRLPKGRSANTQYHIYTLAILILLKDLGYSYFQKYELQKSIAVTLSLIDNDGDLNYFGRGTNQIFAWGPWMFLNLHLKKTDKIIKSESYFYNNIEDCFRNKSLLLKNSYKGKSSYWWDYHYSSVYQAHLFFWLIIRELFVNEKKEKFKSDSNYLGNSFRITDTEFWFMVVFSGRNEYLAEMGPTIINLSTKKHVIFKGPLGPFGGMFGKKNFSKSIVQKNYLGPISEKISSKTKLVTRNVFPNKILVTTNDNILQIRYILKPGQYYLNFPMFFSKWEEKFNIVILFNERPQPLFREQITHGPYGELYIYRTKTIDTVNIIEIKIYEK